MPADALALTFAQAVAGRPVYTDSARQSYTLDERESQRPGRRFCLTEYDPLELD